MFPGFESRTRQHISVGFVACCCPCFEEVFYGFVGFPLSKKTNSFKYQFDLEEWMKNHAMEIPLQIPNYMYLLFFFYIHDLRNSKQLMYKCKGDLKRR